MHIPNEIELVPIDQLVPYAANARTHSEAQIDQIAASMDAFGWTSPVLINAEGGIIAGHGRVMAAQLRDMTEVPCVRLIHLTPDQERALILADNKLALNSGWNEDLLRRELEALTAVGFDIPTIGFDPRELERLFAEPAENSGGSGAGSMAAEFLIPPFTILNAREGWWQDRKRQWIGLGIQSEVGRGENLLKMSDTMLEPDPVKRAAMIAEREAGQNREASGESVYLKGSANLEITADPYRKRGGNGRAKAAPMGQDLLKGEGKFRVGERPADLPSGESRNIPGALTVGVSMQAYGQNEKNRKSGVDTRATQTQDCVQRKIEAGEIEGGMAAGQTGTSIFDPVLCELAYRWFSPKGGTVLDPFAGGSVRGIVCASLGRRYVGIDLRVEQVEANRGQWPAVAARLPEALEGGALSPPDWHVGDSLAVLPELDIEADMIFSCPPYGDLEVYSDDPADISTLNQAGFDAAYADIIRTSVAKLKDDRFACFIVGDYRDKRGIYANFVSKTIAAFEAAGAQLYNEAILVTAVGSLPIRAAKQFRTSRKLGKTHQNVLVFIKGDPKKATAALGPVDVSAAMAEIEEIDE